MGPQKSRQKPRQISLRTLARELGTDTAEIVTVCRAERLFCDGWVEDKKPGRSEWRGFVSLGFAETIRQWSHHGRFRRKPTSTERKDKIVQSAAEEAERVNSFATGFGSEIEAIILALRDDNVDTKLPQGLRLAWDAWQQFLRSGSDYEPLTDCDRCGEKFRPRIDRQFLRTFIDQYGRASSRSRSAEKSLFCCATCRTNG